MTLYEIFKTVRGKKIMFPFWRINPINILDMCFFSYQIEYIFYEFCVKILSSSYNDRELVL